MYLTWAGGHGPFNINATSYPDNNSNANGYQGALQWQIAYLVGNHNYQWVGTCFSSYFPFDPRGSRDLGTSQPNMHLLTRLLWLHN
jgi:hypothetical protein